MSKRVTSITPTGNGDEAIVECDDGTAYRCSGWGPTEIDFPGFERTDDDVVKIAMQFTVDPSVDANAASRGKDG